MFSARLTPDVLFPDRPAARCRSKYLGNIDLLVDRYLQLADTRTERARRVYTDPDKYEKLKEKTRLSKGMPETKTRQTKHLVAAKAVRYSVKRVSYRPIYLHG